MWNWWKKSFVTLILDFEMRIWEDFWRLFVLRSRWNDGSLLDLFPLRGHLFRTDNTKSNSFPAKWSHICKNKFMANSIQAGKSKQIFQPKLVKTKRSKKDNSNSNISGHAWERTSVEISRDLLGWHENLTTVRPSQREMLGWHENLTTVRPWQREIESDIKSDLRLDQT